MVIFYEYLPRRAVIPRFAFMFIMLIGVVCLILLRVLMAEYCLDLFKILCFFRGSSLKVLVGSGLLRL